jgi:hypothetical protein
MRSLVNAPTILSNNNNIQYPIKETITEENQDIQVKQTVKYNENR